MLLISYADYSRHSLPNLENLLTFFFGLFLYWQFSSYSFTLSVVLG